MEAGGGQPLSVSESVQMAWTGTAALGERPGKEESIPSFRRYIHGVHWWYSS